VTKAVLLVARFAFLIEALASCGSEEEPDPADAQARRRPEPGLSWQWQLSGPVDASFDVDVYDVDGVETPAPHRGRTARWRR